MTTINTHKAVALVAPAEECISVRLLPVPGDTDSLHDCGQGGSCRRRTRGGVQFLHRHRPRLLAPLWRAPGKTLGLVAHTCSSYT